MGRRRTRARRRSMRLLLFGVSLGGLLVLAGFGAAVMAPRVARPLRPEDLEPEAMPPVPPLPDDELPESAEPAPAAAPAPAEPVDTAPAEPTPEAAPAPAEPVDTAPAEPTPEAAPEPPAPPAAAEASAPRIEWFGGTGEDTAAALTNLIASENPRAGELVWALQAICANNWARLRGRKELLIRSIQDMLQSGKQGGTWRYKLGWGPQFDKADKITRWASTCAGSRQGQCAKASAPSDRHREFVRRLLAGEVDLLALRGPAGEKMPDPALWPKITSFLQHKGFSAIVAAQGGGEGHTVEEMVAKWGNPKLVADVVGVGFYGHA